MPEAKVREAAAAFSNSDGGVILLGVRDDGRVQGIDTHGENLARLHRALASVRDVGRYELHDLVVDDRSVLVLAISRRREGFTQLPDGRVLVRRGAMNLPLFGADLTRFLSTRALTRFETTPTSVYADDADPELLERLRVAHGWTPDTTGSRLRELGMVEGAASRSRLTVVGALYLTRRPDHHLGKAYVEVFRYRDDTTTYDRRVVLNGPVDSQVEEATRVLADELGVDVVVLGLRRHELERVPQGVLREAVANAVAHRNYEISGQCVRIEIRPGRVVITSPGGLPEPVTLANMREQNAARNPALIGALRRLRLAEDAGLGIDAMETGMDSAMLDPPEFGADESKVDVTLRLGSHSTARERAWLAEVENRGQINSSERMVLLHASRGAVLTNSVVRELVGVDSVHARAALQKLTRLGYLAQTGSRGGAAYSLASDLAPPVGLGLARDELGDVVIHMAAEGAVTNEGVRRRTGLDRVRALALLKSLVDAGHLQQHGTKRGTYYTRRLD